MLWYHSKFEYGQFIVCAELFGQSELTIKNVSYVQSKRGGCLEGLLW